MRYTLQAVTGSGSLMSHSYGVWDDREELVTFLLERGYHETESHSSVYRKGLGEGSHLLSITLIMGRDSI